MAELVVENDDLVLHLTAAEKLEGVHRDLRSPLRTVSAIEVLDDAHAPADRVGFKVGTRIPGIIEVAGIHGPNHKLFAAVHRDTPRGVRITFEDAAFDEWVVGAAEPERVVAQLRAAIGRG